MVVALVMIVKDEEHIIERVLRSVLPKVDTWVIVDTGSSDRTTGIIMKVSTELKKTGNLFFRQWKDFGHNRTGLLELARPLCDWALMMDADDFADGEINGLDDSVPAYMVRIEKGNSVWYRPHLFNSKFIWKYRGVVHEYAYCLDARAVPVKLDCSFVINARCEGKRSQDSNKYLKDALILKDELNREDCDLARTHFYCAQSFRDAGMKGDALKHYKKRVEVGGWAEECYVSCLNIIRLTDVLEDKLRWAWKGQSYNIKRKEIPYEILSYCRKNNIWLEEVFALGVLYKNSMCEGGLFQEMNAYSWSYYDELGLQAIYTGRKYAAKMLFLLAKEDCPPEQKDRLDKNISFC